MGIISVQTPKTKTAIETTFLNKTVKFHLGPALLHMKTNRQLWNGNVEYNEKTKKIHFNVYKIHDMNC